MKKKTVIALSCLLLAFTPVMLFADDDVMEKAQKIFKPIPKTPPALNNNPLTTAKLNLGKMLYFDPRLSASGLISCNTCHNIGTGGVDLQETSVGHGWQKGGEKCTHRI